MKRFVMEVVEMFGDEPVVAQYVEAFDVEAFGGIGVVFLTSRIEHALQFDSAADVMAAWTTQSLLRPLRADGKPNRPLTAYTIAVREVAVMDPSLN